MKPTNLLSRSLIPLYSFLFFFFSNHLFAQCTATSALSGSSFADDNSIGVYAFNNTGNLSASDDSRANASAIIGVLSGNTHYLKSTGFGFSIPSNVTICGIKVEVEKSASNTSILATVTDHSVRLLKGGSVTGSDYATAAEWPTTDAYYTYGGSTDLWGTGWTPADVNASNFGVAFSARINGLVSLLPSALIDHMRITVYYSSVVVPVKFYDFSAETEQKKVKLTWSTTFELYSHYFTVEKLSADQRSWISIDTVMSVQNSAVLNVYHASDHFPQKENTYRIKEVDLNGKSLYSRTAFVKYTAPGEAFVSVYPNPVCDEVTIETASPVLHYQFSDHTGRVLQSGSSDELYVKLHMSEMKAGVYLLRVKTKEGEVVKRVVKR